MTLLLLALLSQEEVLDLNEALWGEKVPNVLKGIAVAYDVRRDRVYTAGILSRHIAVTDPKKGHPIAAVEHGVSGFNVAMLRFDGERDRLFWISQSNGSIRLIDVAKLQLAAKHDGAAGKERYPVKDAVIDPATGSLYVADSEAGTITEFDGGTLQVRRVLRDARAPFDLAWDGRLLALDARKKDGTLLADGSVLRKFEGRPPRRVAAGEGRIFLSGDRLQALSPEGRELWTAAADRDVHEMLAFNGRLVVVCRDGDPCSTVVVFDAATGRRLGRIVVRYESSWAAADPAGDRIFVGNGGDGSVSVVDLKELKETSRLDVANAVEQIVVDPKTGRRFLLNRLGGSEIYVWEKELKRLDLGMWPVEMALEGRSLYVLSHYESAIRVLDADRLEETGRIPLGIPGSRTDSLSDFAVAGGLAACAIPEAEAVVVVDLEARKPLAVWKPTGFQGGKDLGPGRLQVGVDAARRRIVAWAPMTGQVWSFSVGSLREDGALKLGHGRRNGSYAIDLLYLWAERDLAFAGPDVIDLKTFQTCGRCDRMDKIAGVSNGRLFGLAAGPDGDEALVELDPRTFRSISRSHLLRTDSLRCQVTIEGDRIYVADMGAARVAVFKVP